MSSARWNVTFKPFNGALSCSAFHAIIVTFRYQVLGPNEVGHGKGKMLQLKYICSTLFYDKGPRVCILCPNSWVDEEAGEDAREEGGQTGGLALPLLQDASALSLCEEVLHRMILLLQHLPDFVGETGYQNLATHIEHWAKKMQSSAYGCVFKLRCSKGLQRANHQLPNLNMSL